MTVPINEYSGKVVLITGIGGGQGRAAALLFAQHGATVVGCDVNGSACEETVALARKVGIVIDAGGAVDLGDPDAASAWVEAAAAKHGRIDVVYNNGSAARFAPVDEMSIDDWRFTMRNEIDLIFHVVRSAWRHLQKQGGVIINIASIAGHAGAKAAPQLAHATAKGAVLAMTRQLAVEGAPSNIRVVSISPGVIETPGTRELLQNPDVAKMMMGEQLIQRFGQPEEIVSVALFVASNGASFITGSDIVVDGGRLAL